MMHQIAQKSMIEAYPEIQHANQTPQVVTIHFAIIAYRMLFDAIDDKPVPFDIFHDAIDTKIYSKELYRAAYRLSKTE